MPSTICEYIKQDLSNRIGSRAGLPIDLTITALSRHYGVSFTPVREALRDLVTEGILLKHVNGRVEVNSSLAHQGGAAAEAARPELPSRSAELESAIAAEVIGRSLRGESDYLREEATARQHGVGRTAIRQVFGRLAGQGLLVHVPRCGWLVRPFEEADLSAYLKIRETLELKAMDLARPHLVDADLRRMLAGNRAAARSPRLDNDLHGYLVAKAGNPYIRDFFDRHGTYYTTLFDYAAPEARVVKQMARQHRKILRALIAQDWPRARRELAHHIRAQRPIVETLMRRIGRPDARSAAPEDTAR